MSCCVWWLLIVKYTNLAYCQAFFACISPTKNPSILVLLPWSNLIVFSSWDPSAKSLSNCDIYWVFSEQLLKLFLLTQLSISNHIYHLGWYVSISSRCCKAFRHLSWLVNEHTITFFLPLAKMYGGIRWCIQYVMANDLPFVKMICDDFKHVWHLRFPA